MPIEVSVELFDMLAADMKVAKNKKTNCLDVVESVEECLCLVLQGSLKQINAIGCVETNNNQFSFEIPEPVIFSDIVVKKIVNLFNIRIVHFIKIHNLRI
ncbi:hypothetical protein CAEBREN_07909 [Caenorhabditis brenneri]|uniref:Uncharacterized protein n=1 Tax=Caenorhabditis brenneri TaxID=135651 RepID=G0NGB8_CAEBE|nr:hypothetical protein CAEBREN_07909 [Caenorhabditis brenneri]